jgi:Flp pilus assembly protein TadD
LPQAHIAMGLLHSEHGDLGRALDEYRVALRGLPNDAFVWARVGYTQRRLGNWAAADTAYQNAIRLDPRDASCHYDLGAITYMVTRRYADAVQAFDRALSLAPDLRAAAVRKGMAYIFWKGNLDTLRAALDAMPMDADLGDPGTAVSCRAELLLWERKSDSLLALVGSVRGGGYYGHVLFVPALYAAWAHRLRGDGGAARTAFASALAVLDTVADTGPDGWQVHAARGLALAAVGQRAGALREARWLQTSMLYRRDATFGPLVAERRAFILAQAGETDAALDEIERLLAGPSILSVHTLRLDPRWDPIREHPRFKALLVKYANPERPAR